MHTRQLTLTKREMQVLKLIASGFNNFEIAKKLFISMHTAKAHVASILTKLKERNRLRAAIKAIKLGLIKI
ncbi:MAG: LuxR C-terminal-related transcriptional regulator [Candidatus Gastranaerophilales bacterium]|nr:LuxR C-terminal-related transcriptional regulator [Candidatus Gastranaerophilales bacterium]